MKTQSASQPNDDKTAMFRPAFEHVQASETLWRRFVELGLPARAQEAWHYADVGAFSRESWAMAAPADGAAVRSLLSELALDPATSLVLANGRVLDDNGIEPVAAAAAGALHAHSLATLNEALTPRAAVITIAAGEAKTLTVASLTLPAGDGEMAHPRIAIRVAAGAQADLRLIFAGSAGKRYWSNPVVDITLGEGAEARLVSVASEGENALHTGVIAATVGKAARFASTELILGGRSIRRETLVDFVGEDGAAELAGAYLGGGETRIDVRSEVSHLSPRCRSRQLYRGVLDDKAFAAFQGRVYVAPHAQGTDAAQSTRSLLLQRTAEAAAKPELEIHADDVKCSHGATVGELDSDMLFYLEARGISPAEARSMLVKAFIGEVLETITDESLRDRNIDRVGQWMTGRGEGA